MPTVSVEINRWLLDSPEAMYECLHDMHSKGPKGFRGQVRVQLVPPPPELPEDYVEQHLWDLELNDNTYFDRPSVHAVTGQVVLFFGGVLQVITPEEYTAQFGEEL